MLTAAVPAVEACHWKDDASDPGELPCGVQATQGFVPLDASRAAAIAKGRDFFALCEEHALVYFQHMIDACQSHPTANHPSHAMRSGSSYALGHEYDSDPYCDNCYADDERVLTRPCPDADLKGTVDGERRD